MTDKRHRHRNPAQHPMTPRERDAMQYVLGIIDRMQRAEAHADAADKALGQATKQLRALSRTLAKFEQELSK